MSGISVCMTEGSGTTTYEVHMGEDEWDSSPLSVWGLAHRLGQAAVIDTGDHGREAVVLHYKSFKCRLICSLRREYKARGREHMRQESKVWVLNVAPEIWQVCSLFIPRLNYCTSLCLPSSRKGHGEQWTKRLWVLLPWIQPDLY